MIDFIPYLLQAIGGLLAVLIAILGWFGSHILAQLNGIKKSLENTKLGFQEDINDLDVRVTRLEVYNSLHHLGTEYE